MTSYDPLRKQLVTLIVFHVLITDILSDSLTPNLLNVVQNRHIRFLPHTKKVCLQLPLSTRGGGWLTGGA